MGWWKNTKVFKSTSGDGNGAGDNYAGLPPGDIPPWEPGFEFNFGREVLGPDGNYYRCIVEHNSSDIFANDLAALYWVIFAGPGISDDNVDEYPDAVSFPVTGATDVIYIAADTNRIYRWTGATYVQIGDGGDDNVDQYADLASFPVTGVVDVIYIAADTDLIYRWDGATYKPLGSTTQAGHTIHESPIAAPVTQRIKMVFAGSGVTVADSTDITYGPHTLVTIPGPPSAKEEFYLERVETIDQPLQVQLEYFTFVQGGTEISNVVNSVAGGTFLMSINFVCQNTSNAGQVRVIPRIGGAQVFGEPYRVEPENGVNRYYIGIQKRVALAAGNNTINLHFENLGIGTARIYEANITLKEI